MALKAKIFKIELQIADMDRHYYQTHQLTIAQHPSESDRRMMARIVAFCLHANERLLFTKGLSTDSEPDIWQKSLSDIIELWIDLGQLDSKRIRKACGRADQVCIYTYQPRSAKIWWEQNEADLARFKNLTVVHLDEQGDEVVESLVTRNMQLQCTIQDQQFWLANGEISVEMQIDKCKSH